jgi:hypothetical protein
MGHISKSIARVLDIPRLLASAKPFKNIQLITMGEILYRLMNKTLCLQFHDFFSLTCHHINFGHQFGVAIKGCEVVVHDI